MYIEVDPDVQAFDPKTGQPTGRKVFINARMRRVAVDDSGAIWFTYPSADTGTYFTIPVRRKHGCCTQTPRRPGNKRAFGAGRGGPGAARAGIRAAGAIGDDLWVVAQFYGSMMVKVRQP